MTFKVNIITDSISPIDARLTTFTLSYPRFIHAEVMTHRVFSRNASSSRAIPVKRIIGQVIDDPALPIYWGKNQKGMQAEEEIDPTRASAATRIWLTARDDAVAHARELIVMLVNLLI
jgi:thymidylate synthase ThyX